MGPNPADILPVELPNLETEAARENARVTMRAILQSQGATHDLRAAVIRTMQNQGLGRPEDYVRVWNIARSEERQMRAADRFTADPSRVVPATELPRDGTIQPGEPAYRYEVLVTATSVPFRQRSALITVTSDVPLSAEEAMERARRADTITSQRRDTSLRIGQADTEVTLTARIITAARR